MYVYMWMDVCIYIAVFTIYIIYIYFCNYINKRQHRTMIRSLFLQGLDEDDNVCDNVCTDL